jgi:hypothetical protein
LRSHNDNRSGTGLDCSSSPNSRSETPACS